MSADDYIIQLVDEDEAAENGGYTLTLHQDSDFDFSPRDADCLLGLWLGRSHRHYKIGDETLPDEVEKRGPKFIERWIKIHYKARVIVRVGMLDHSGVHFYAGGGAHWSDSQGWDSATCGWIFDTPATLKETGCDVFTDEQIRDGLVAEIEEYDKFSRGEVFGYVIQKDGEEVDSCWGYIGQEYAEEEARGALQAVLAA